ncbi:hypothetical protein [Flavihumibacter petaseus]|uniref:Lipoprotein n=1 Tax=Flavihumibacter petaseus NBRC 106054 TaxID=1220578 RepID=A0A0E9N5J9_9BACT|nr:hypothetical protein [Flavihumibacter petaseus]GAO44620.1 hypothetical protein FPE01S_03_06590 [Flavihumibacter petaseus NBRC 106054]
MKKIWIIPAAFAFMAAVSCKQLGQEARAAAAPTGVSNWTEKDASGKDGVLGITIAESGFSRRTVKLPVAWKETLGADSLVIEKIPAGTDPLDLYAVPHLSIRFLAGAGEIGLPEDYEKFRGTSSAGEERWIDKHAAEWNGHAFHESLFYGRNDKHVFMEWLVSQPWLAEMNSCEHELPFSRSAKLVITKKPNAFDIALK